MAYTSQLVLLREAVLKAIVADQTANLYVYNDFNPASTHIPLARLEDQATKDGRLWVIGGLIDDNDRKTRGTPGVSDSSILVRREVVIQVCYQQSDIVADEVTKLDTLCGLIEQLRDTIKNCDYSNVLGREGPLPAWIRNEALKSEDGVPYHYYMLREANVFESYFNAWFTYPHQ